MLLYINIDTPCTHFRYPDEHLSLIFVAVGLNRVCENMLEIHYFSTLVLGCLKPNYVCHEERTYSNLSSVFLKHNVVYYQYYSLLKYITKTLFPFDPTDYL